MSSQSTSAPNTAANEKPAFTGPITTQFFDGILLDLDGTIVDSTAAIVKHWHKSVHQFSPALPDLEKIDRMQRIHRVGQELGVDPTEIMATSHGRRSIDTINLYDPTKATLECSSPALLSPPSASCIVAS